MNGPFWHFARRMGRHRTAIVLAVCCAAVSAGGLGGGLVALGPMLEIVLGQSQGLAELVQAWGVAHPEWQLPAGLVSVLPDDARGSLGFLLSGLAVLTVIGASANFLHQYISVTLCASIVARVRLEAFAHAIRQPLATVVHRGPAEYTSRIVRDAGELHAGLSVLLGKLTAQVLKGVAAFFAAIWFDWRLTIFALIVGPVVAVILRKTGKRITRGMRGSLQAQQELLRLATESMVGLRSVKAAGAEREMIHRFADINRRSLAEQLRARLARALASPLIELVAILVAVGLAYLAGVQIIDGKAQFADFALAMGSLAAMGSSFRPVTAFASEISAANAPAGRLLEVLHAPPDTEGETALRLPPTPSSTIRLEGVSVRYPGATTDALHRVSLEIRAGEHVAIVGPNGCGKSTLLAVLAKLLVPTDGRVVVDGVDLAACRTRGWRRLVALVAQEPFIVSGTVEENIRLGTAHASRESVIAAARQAHAMDFILRLPGGLDAVVAELGGSLSGGQRQRIAIARAALAQPSLLLLDEATSQVDAESEREIAAAIRDLGAGRTVVTVAHRFATVLSADRIVVMDGGGVIDAGSHDELLSRCDLYARLARAQFLTTEPITQS